MFFNTFPMFLDLKTWIILQISLGSLVFAVTILLVNFVNIELLDKEKEENISDRKQIMLLFFGIPFFLVVWLAYAHYVDAFFYFEKKHCTRIYILLYIFLVDRE